MFQNGVSKSVSFPISIALTWPAEPQVPSCSIPRSHLLGEILQDAHGETAWMDVTLGPFETWLVELISEMLHNVVLDAQDLGVKGAPLPTGALAPRAGAGVK